ncbi:MAG: hypothetical protein VX086_07955 [Pseudomonadota bacterium]|nr:hypothetical protein [Pseudomonadota bacterium]
MKIYQVGGAVRDLLLGIEPKDRDWVVVGANQQELLTKGFKKVGRAFPVFLHPETKEEYALARTEKKQGEGHSGFETFFHSKITLQEDLARRDFTVNAIAIDQNGKLIDPFNGIEDLKKKLLRHVTVAFVEDPLRVLRAARFSAKLMFSIAPETMALLSIIVQSGELASLSNERIQREFMLSLQAPAPYRFFATLHDCGALSQVFSECNHIELINPRSVIYKQFKRIKNPSERDYLILLAVYISTLKKNKEIFDFLKLVKRLKFSKLIQEQVAIATEHWQIIVNASNSSSHSTLELLKKTDAFRRVTRFKQILVSLRAIIPTRGNDNKENQSLRFLEYIVDNPVSIKKFLKNNSVESTKSHQIQLIIDQKRREAIDQARELFFHNRQN